MHKGWAMNSRRFGLLLFVFGGALLLSPASGFAAQAVTTRASIDSTGVEGNGDSSDSSISADGRYMAFHSTAVNLVSGDLNGTWDVFVRDRQTGATTRISVDSSGVQGNGASYDPSISADGRYVAFWSRADNLVTGDTNFIFDIFVHDRQTGATTRVSVYSGGVQGNGGSYDPSISADGRYVAFDSTAVNLVTGDTNATGDVFVHDRQTGATTRVSVDSSGVQGNGGSYRPSISADGRYVAFDSTADNLVTGDTNATDDVFVHDRQTGATTRVSVDSSGGQGDNGSYRPSISADGRYVAFEADASNLVSTDTNITGDVSVHDRQTGATTRVSVDSSGGQGDNGSYRPSISADGRYVAFGSGASNLVTGDTNAMEDVFVHDRRTGATIMVSVDSSGVQGNGGSYRPSISADGRYVAFDSTADNLVTGDTNAAYDVFVRGPLVSFPWPMFLPAITHKANYQVRSGNCLVGGDSYQGQGRAGGDALTCGE